MGRGRQIETWGAIGTLAVALTLAACEKPQLRSERSTETEESSADAGKTSRAKAPAERSATERKPASPASPPAPPAPKAKPARAVDPAVRAREIVQHRAKLNAHLAGILSLESDLSRHSSQLNALRGELSSVRARQAARRSSGVLVERIDGKSTRVDHAKVAAELEARIRAEEQIIAQLTQSIEAARGQHRHLASEFDRLWQE